MKPLIFFLLASSPDAVKINVINKSSCHSLHFICIYRKVKYAFCMNSNRNQATVYTLHRPDLYKLKLTSNPFLAKSVISFWKVPMSLSSTSLSPYTL